MTTLGYSYDSAGRRSIVQQRKRSRHDHEPNPPPGLDALGNWDNIHTDGSDVGRDHNKQNQLTTITPSGQGSTTLYYDNNGNLTQDENGKTLVYDAWNRLVAYKNGSTTLVSYEYDAMYRRVQETANSVTTDLYYNDRWQVVEEQVSGVTTMQYVWSPVQLRKSETIVADLLILRDRDADADPGTGDHGLTGSGLEERLYAQQDRNLNLTSLTDTSGVVQERFIYDPYGKPTVLGTV
ncbi:hypothetical protein [Fontivita pretiosa]|uniref:hypothetical protein n=1 Tax=Fontivita pretiosa TaxID=2989684 RepID=UPI003D170C6D